MSRKLLSNYLPRRGISVVAREIQMLTSPHQRPASEIQTLFPLHLPDVWAPSQYLIDMGLRPALARRLSTVYMDIVARYRQVFESYFRRAIQGSSHHHPEHYCDIFIIQFKGIIQVLESQFMSAALAWLCRTGLPPALFWPQCIDVRITVYTTLYEAHRPWFRYAWMPQRKLRSFRGLASKQHRSLWMQLVILSLFSKFLLTRNCCTLNQTSNRIELPEEDLPTKMVTDLLFFCGHLSHFLEAVCIRAPPAKINCFIDS
jgi:hypothetical protein